MRTPALAAAAALAAATVLGIGSARAFHTPFAYRADRFELDGNRFGAHDGTVDLADDFDDGFLAPTWYRAYGTSSESGGFLVVKAPGVHFPSPDGSLLDLSIAASASPTWVYDGMGDFTATAYWEGVLPPVGHHYHFSVYTFGSGSGLFAETFGVAITRTDQGLFMEQHLTEIDQYAGIFKNTQLLFHEIQDADVTGELGFRIEFDDVTNQATTAFSLDGGATWQNPFPPGTIFVGRTTAQFLLSADPIAEAVVTTTTSSTTTTTLPGPGTCFALGCRRSLFPEKTKLAIKDKSSDRADLVSWKWKKGMATDVSAWGLPQVSPGYDFCIGDAAGAALLHVRIPPGGTCGGGPCWKATGNGFKFTDSAGANGGVRKVLLKAGVDGKASVIVKAQGENLDVPGLPLALPITVRLSNDLGECWAETYDATGLVKNTSMQFTGKGGSPSGAFVD